MNYILPDWLYDNIKYVVTIVMPAVSVLYVGLAGIWGWPYADEVARTIADLAGSEPIELPHLLEAIQLHAMDAYLDP